MSRKVLFNSEPFSKRKGSPFFRTFFIFVRSNTILLVPSYVEFLPHLFSDKLTRWTPPSPCGLYPFLSAASQASSLVPSSLSGVSIEMAHMILTNTGNTLHLFMPECGVGWQQLSTMVGGSESHAFVE